MIRGLVCDIDDTLFLERDYVRSGFTHVAGLAGRSPTEVHAFAAWLWQAFEAGVRDDTFDRFLQAFPEVAQRISTADLVAAYRTHAPTIALAAGWADTLDDLRSRGIRLGVLSDGPVDSQRAKAKVLELDRWFDPIILTGGFDAGFAKPATSGFEAIARKWDARPDELAYVGDNPAKDFAGPRQLGWLTIRLRHPAQLRYEQEPIGDAFREDVEIRRPADLLAHLRPGV